MDALIHGLKKAVYSLPPNLSQTIKRTYFRYQIARKEFKTNEPEYNMLHNWIKPGDTVIDAGANVGHYTLKFSKLVGKDGRVFAFEPCPESFELLAANIMLSPFRNVSLFNAAVGCSNANVCMSIPSVNGIDNLYECNISENGDLKVVCLPIDCICSNQKVSLVKIDVEGHELQVLQGMKTLIEKFHPLFIIEGSSLQVEDFLKSYGYFYKSISIKGSPNRIFIAKQ